MQWVGLEGDGEDHLLVLCFFLRKQTRQRGEGQKRRPGTGEEDDEREEEDGGWKKERRGIEMHLVEPRAFGEVAELRDRRAREEIREETQADEAQGGKGMDLLVESDDVRLKRSMQQSQLVSKDEDRVTRGEETIFPAPGNGKSRPPPSPPSPLPAR